MVSRQDLVHGQGTDVPAPMAIGALTTGWAWADTADFADDIDVLNYALTLEYLEAAFYQQGNSAGLLSGDPQAFLADIQADEEAHVRALSDTVNQLGGTPAEKPMVDFGGAFDSDQSYLTTSHTFENVGVSAYLGAAGFLQDKTLLQAAAGIFGVEARHAAVVGNLLGLPAETGVFVDAVEKPLTKTEVLSKVSPFLVQMQGGMPAGGVDTGGGGTGGAEHTGLIAAGGAVLLGAGAAAYLSNRRRDRVDE